MCVDRGLEPIVTLHHFTHPFWLGEEFWLRPGSPDIFARHVERVVPALAPYCRRWVTINEPNIVTLMGWIEGSCPPGRRMAVADAFSALDNILTAHVLAADVVTALQPEAEVTVNTSSSSIYEHDRMLLDLLQLRDAGVDPDDVDALHRRAPDGARRRLSAAPRRGGGDTPFLRRGVPVRRGARAQPRCGLGPAARRDPAPGAAARDRGGLRVVAAPQHGRRRLRLVRPGGQPCHARPRTAHAGRPAGLVLRAGLLGRGVAPGRAARLVPHGVRAAPRPPAVGRGERHGDADGRRARRPARGRHGPAPLHPRAPGRHGRRRRGGRPRDRLLPLVADGQLRVGHLRAPLRHLRGGPQRPQGRPLHGHRCRRRRCGRGVRPGGGRPARRRQQRVLGRPSS